MELFKLKEEYTKLLEQWGYQVYLPQREAGLSAQILKDKTIYLIKTNNS